MPAPPPPPLPPLGPTSGPSPPAPGLEGAEHQEEEEERWVEDCGNSISDVKLVERGRGGPVLRADVPAPPIRSLLLLPSFNWIRTRRLLMYTPAKQTVKGREGLNVSVVVVVAAAVVVVVILLVVADAAVILAAIAV